MWNARDISVVTADVAAEPAAERVIEKLRARRLPVERGSAARYLVVCCRTVDATLLKRLKVWSTTSAERTILVTESAPSSSDAWQALRHGATDIVTLADADGVADRLERWLQLDELLVSPLVTTTLIGESPGWLALLRELVDLARFSNINLMIGGESGTGKELAARLMHTLECRATGVRCILLTDPHLTKPAGDEDLRQLDFPAVVLAGAFERGWAQGRLPKDSRVVDPDVDPPARLASLADQLVLPVLDVQRVDAKGLTLSERQERRVAEGGLLRLAALMEQVIDHDKVAHVDFGTGNDRYKADWMEQVRPRYALTCLRPGNPRHWPELARWTIAKLVSRRPAG